MWERNEAKEMENARWGAGGGHERESQKCQVESKRKGAKEQKREKKGERGSKKEGLLERERSHKSVYV